MLGKIYAAMVTSGQGKGGDNKDMSSVLNNGSGFDYMRMFINLQECGTDEFASTWLTGEQTTGLELISLGMPTMPGYQICIIASTTTSPSAMSSCAMPIVPVSQARMQEKMKEYKAEVRFMRALFYYHALDFYPQYSDGDRE